MAEMSGEGKFQKSSHVNLSLLFMIESYTCWLLGFANSVFFLFIIHILSVIVVKLPKVYCSYLAV